VVGQREGKTIATVNGEVTFSLRRCASGIHLTRVHRCAGPERSVTSEVNALFPTMEGFAKFLENDEMRYVHPLTYRLLHDAFIELLEPAD